MGSTGAFCVLGLNSPFTHYYCWHVPTLTSLSTHSLCDRFAVTRRASLSCDCDIAVCLGARRRSYLVSVWHLQRCGTPLLVGLHSPIAAAGWGPVWVMCGGFPAQGMVIGRPRRHNRVIRCIFAFQLSFLPYCWRQPSRQFAHLQIFLG